MKNRILLLAGLALFATAAAAQDEGAVPDDALDLTMVLMPEGATLPEAVTRVIELPAAAAEAARENATRGLETANAARDRDAPGIDTAEEAREQSLERAQQGREDAGRGPPDFVSGPDGGGQPETPAIPDVGPPDNAGPPDSTGAPETPGPPGG